MPSCRLLLLGPVRLLDSDGAAKEGFGQVIGSKQGSYRIGPTN